MHNTKIKTAIALALTIIAPCLAIEYLYGHWIPYQLNGRQFLLFYATHIATGVGVLCYLAYRNTLHKSFLLFYLLMTIMISASRMVQGVWNHKPILFLILLSILQFFVITIFNKRRQKMS